LILNGALFNAGEQILLPAPGYPCNRHFVAMFDATPVALPVGAQTAFQPSAAMVASAWTERVKGIVIASPSNPTGTSIAPQELGQVIAAARQRGGTVIVDEIYHGLTYGTAPASTALALSHDLCVVNSFSKYFNLTGWRVGWIVAPAEVVPELERFAQNAFICPPAPAQHAALAALGPAAIEIFEMRREEFRQRRDFLVPALRELGFVIPVEPDGAFYIYADCSRFAEDSFRFAFDVLERAGVAITPGRDFGGLQPERFVRFAYTRSLQQIELAVERLRHYLIRR
jgi:aspartate/methionine/tyrosine aminotransferase